MPAKQSDFADGARLFAELAESRPNCSGSSGSSSSVSSARRLLTFAYSQALSWRSCASSSSKLRYALAPPSCTSQKGFLFPSRKRKKRPEIDKRFRRFGTMSKPTRERVFLLYTSDCCFTQTSAPEEVKSWCAHWAAGPDLSRQTHPRADFRAPVSMLNYRANCRAEIPCANCNTDLFRTDFWRLQN